MTPAQIQNQVRKQRVAQGLSPTVTAGPFLEALAAEVLEECSCSDCRSQDDA